MSPALLNPLLKQADYISKGDQDLSQNLLAMAYKNYSSALMKGKHLSVPEMVVFMKNRSKELKSGARNYYGNNGSYSGKDVYRKLNYYQGNVEIHSINYADSDNCEDEAAGKGSLTAELAVKDVFRTVAFKIDFKKFLKKLHATEKEILDLKLSGYSYKEISNKLKLSYATIKSLLNDVMEKFIQFFDLSRDHTLAI